MNQYIQNHGTNIVYMTKIYEPCILLITLRLTLKILLIIRDTFLKHYKNIEIKFDLNHNQTLLVSPVTGNLMVNISFWLMQVLFLFRWITHDADSINLLQYLLRPKVTLKHSVISLSSSMISGVIWKKQWNRASCLVIRPILLM